MKFMNQARAFGRKVAGKVAAVGAGVTVMAGEVLAAVPADVTTATTAAKTDTLEVGTAFVVIVIALRALHLMKRA